MARSIKQQYTIQRKRVVNLVKRMSERGYYGIDNIVPPVPKKITKASVRRLKKIRVQYIAERAEYAGKESYGEIISGTEGLSLERKHSAKKARQTKAFRRRLHSAIARINQQMAERAEDSIEKWEEQRRELDIEQRIRFDVDKSYREQFEEGTFLLDKVQQLINNASQGQQHAAQQMQSILDNAIGTLGREQVARNIATSDEDIISEVQDTLLYKPASTGYANHIGTFKRILTHESPSAEEYQDWMYGREQDEYVDDQDNWYGYDDFGETTTADFD